MLLLLQFAAMNWEEEEAIHIKWRYENAAAAARRLCGSQQHCGDGKGALESGGGLSSLSGLISARPYHGLSVGDSGRHCCFTPL